MTPLEAIAFANAALAALETVFPVIAEGVKGGEVSVADQQKVRDKLESLKTRAAAQFQGPHWET